MFANRIVSRAVMCLTAAQMVIAAPDVVASQQAPVKSELTGVTLPDGYKANKGMLTRAAARSLMDMTAKRFAQTVKDVEMFEVKNPTVPGPDSLLASVTMRGWTLQFEKPESPNERVAWMTRADRPDARYLTLVTFDRKTTTVYFAAAATAVVAQAPPVSAAPVPAAPIPAAPIPAAPPATPPPATPPTATPPAARPPAATSPAASPAPIQVPSTWAYTRTTFADGWTAVDEGRWVRGTKGNVTALLHLSAPDTKNYVNQDGEQAVWNALVVPRYRDLTNVWVRKPFWDDYTAKIVLGEGTEIASGRRVYIALYSRAYTAPWIEYQTPDKATFERELTVIQRESGTNWAALNRDGLNKFSVAAADLPGEWRASSAAGVQYVSTVTGNSMGMGAVSNVDNFTFRNDGSYSSTWRGAGGMAGNQRFAGANYSGRVQMNGPWQMSLTNRFKNQTETFDVWFEVANGGRVLVLRRDGYDIRLVRAP